MSDSESDSLELHDIQWDNENERTSPESNSSSSSSPVLHDINWDEINVAFDYEDHLSRSPQIKAVIDNDLPHLKALLNMGKSVNVNDNLGYTPLHVSISEKNKEIFNYLLTVENIRIDAESFEGVTPLLLALKDNEESYARELLKMGADVNLARDSGETPLHYSIDNSIEIAQELILKGAVIDAQNDEGETPLFIACDKNRIDHIHMLLYYEADPTIPNIKHILPFASSLSSTLEVQGILFNYTFGAGRYKIGLVNFTKIMALQSCFFYKIIEKDIDIFYNHKDFKYLVENLPDIKSDMFKIFIEKYKNLAADFFCMHNPIKLYKCQYHSVKIPVDFTVFFCMLSETTYMGEIVDRFESDICSSDHSLVDCSLSEDALTKLLFSLLSHGVTLTSYDVSMVYRYYKYGDLFKLLLHQEIRDFPYVSGENFAEDFLMARLIYQPLLSVSSVVTARFINSQCAQHLRKFFFLIQEPPCYGTSGRESSFPTIPSLKDVARNAARKCLIEMYNIKNNIQFFTILKWLPICQVVKEILSYERSIY